MSKTVFPHSAPPATAAPVADERVTMSPEHAELFRSLDRLISIGSYYTPEHARYQEVAREAHSAVRASLLGGTLLEIECTSEGFFVHDVFIDHNHKKTARVFQLLDALNIGLLQIQSTASAADLIEAISSLKYHQVTYAGKKNFEEIEIAGLPDTVTTVSQSLYVRTRDRSAGPGGTRPREGSADHYVIPDANLVPTADGQILERKFLGIISGIMNSGDPTQLKNTVSDEVRNSILNQWVSDSAVNNIRDIMVALKKTNSDPMILEHLISHAQTALQMTGDPDLVELVFARLRKETGIKSDKPKPLLSNRPKPKNPARRTVTYAMTPDQMNEAIAELTAEADNLDDLIGPSSADCLGICAQVLCSAPTEAMMPGIGSTIFRILSADNVTAEDLRISVSGLTALLKTGSRDMADAVMPMFFSPLRKFHPEHLGPVWLSVWKSLVEIDHKRLAWPHLVNELLLGVAWDDPAQRLALYESLSQVGVGDGEEMLERLEELQALREKSWAPQVFHAPAPLLYPVHIVLLGSSMSREHGPKLHERLAHQRAQRLGNLLVGIMGHYKQSNKLIYLAILQQGVSEKIEPKLRDLGSRLLKSAVKGVLPEDRDDPWVAEALGWLGRLDMKRAKPILNNVLKEKKFFFWPVWPAECRQAAREALADQKEDGAIEKREASGDEIQ